MTQPLRGRGEFEQLRAQGRRISSGVTWCVHRADSAHVPPRIAFAIGRAVGPAVVRNRIKRRLRAIVRDLGPLPAGDYLVGVRPAAARATFTQLKTAMTELVGRCRGMS